MFIISFGRCLIAKLFAKCFLFGFVLGMRGMRTLVQRLWSFAVAVDAITVKGMKKGIGDKLKVLNIPITKEREETLLFLIFTLNNNYGIVSISDGFTLLKYRLMTIVSNKMNPRATYISFSSRSRLRKYL